MIVRKRPLQLFHLLISVIFALIFVEVLVRVFNPVSSLYPRFKFSDAYGQQVYENAKMVHTLPGRYTFLYTTNEYGHRGKAIAPAQHYYKKTVLVLGDSNSFGIGVNDREEYPARLAEVLKEDYIVINLANPAWGLTQEIRRYYDFGILYHPTIVVLQFSANDPDDNFNNMVTTVEDGKFVFRNSSNKINLIKKYLSRSIIQKSQAYNFARERIYDLYHKWYVERAATKYRVEKHDENPVPVKEEFYDTLLTAFANDLNTHGIKLVFISVNNELDEFPHIKKNILSLYSEGKLHYVDTMPWFNNVVNYQSAEGHAWGREAHDIVGRNLATSIKMITD